MEEDKTKKKEKGKAKEERFYPAEEQGIEKEESPDELSEDMDTGEKEEDVYTEEGREKLTDEDEISPREEAFMEGEQETKLGECANCGKPLEDVENPVEREMNGEVYLFCSKDCAKHFRAE